MISTADLSFEYWTIWRSGLGGRWPTRQCSSSSSFSVLEIWLPFGFEEMPRRKSVTSSVLECRKMISNRMPRIVNSWPSFEKVAWRVTSPDALYAPPPRHSMYGKGSGRSHDGTHDGTHDGRVSPGPGHEFSAFCKADRSSKSGKVSNMRMATSCISPV